MRIVCISDTHAEHTELDVPSGDVLIHAGDFSHFSSSIGMLRDFNEWLGELPHRCKVVVPGNHDHLLVDPKNRTAITNATLLIDSGMKIGDVRIWGSPMTPLPNVAFGKPDAEDRKKAWARIPQGTNILVTHSPAFGILDRETDSDAHQGCEKLLDAVRRLEPLLHVCGHIHSAYGREWHAHTYHVNAALFDKAMGGVERNPVVIDLEVLKSALKSHRRAAR